MGTSEPSLRRPKSSVAGAVEAPDDPERKSGIVGPKTLYTSISIGCPSNSERG